MTFLIELPYYDRYETLQNIGSPQALREMATRLEMFYGKHGYWTTLMRYLLKMQRQGHEIRWLESMPQKKLADIIGINEAEQQANAARAAYYDGKPEVAMALFRKAAARFIAINNMRGHYRKRNFTAALKESEESKNNQPIVVWTGIGHLPEIKKLATHAITRGAQVTQEQIPYTEGSLALLFHEKVRSPAKLSKEQIARALFAHYAESKFGLALPLEIARQKAAEMAARASVEDVMQVSRDIPLRRTDTLERLLKDQPR